MNEMVSKTTDYNTKEISKSVSSHYTKTYAALFLGLGVLFLVGFSNMPSAHDAAHDVRHSIGFPCH